MFNIGDKVICINDDLNNIQGIFEIKKSRIYTIKHIMEIGSNNILLYFEEINKSYLSTRFISLLDYRKQKINKIKERICLK